MVSQRMYITESEKDNIRDMYVEKTKRNYIFEMCTTVDGKYFIIQDEVFDIQEQKTIGNLWGSMDVFKTIFETIKLEDEGYTQIRENFLSLPIVESQQNLYGLRDILLEFNFLQDTWLGRQFKSAGDSIADFAKTSYEGLKNFGIAVSKGEWGNILTLLAKGVRYLLRKLKDAMYSNIGMIVDAILIATGVGAGAAKVAWGLIVALDVYQLLFNDWPDEEKNDPMWLKFLYLGIDVLGFVSAGAAAKAAKAGIAPLRALAKSPAKIAQFLERSPRIKGFIKSMIEGMKGVPARLQSVMKTLSTKFPKGAGFINSILGGLRNISTKFTESLQKLLGQTAGKGASSGIKTGGVLYGFDKVLHGASSAGGVNKEAMVAAQKYDNVISKHYGGKDPFDS
jgi:hypothetical protein